MQPAALYERSIQHFLSPVNHFLESPNVSEIMINGPDNICIESSGQIHRTDVHFASHDSLAAAATNIAEFNGIALGESQLTMDGKLPNGARVHIVCPPAVQSGVHITIRKYRKATFRIADLVSCQSITPEAAEYVQLCVGMKRNVLVSGGTGTGKTSFLNALLTCVPDGERIVTIEDTPELTCPNSKHIVSLVAANAAPDANITIRELFANALRMRPDRIIVGEVRRGEALDLVQSMMSGHSGSLGTVHGGSPDDAVIRLETLCLMNDLEMPVYVARQQVAAAIDVVIQLRRHSDGRRVVHSISECCGTNSEGNYELQRMFMMTPDPDKPDLKWTGRRSHFAALPWEYGVQDGVRLTKEYFGIENQS